jgi:hypothetical protein
MTLVYTRALMTTSAPTPPTPSDPIQDFINDEDWAFVFDANQGITKSGSDVTNWVDAKNGYDAVFPSSARPTISTNLNGYEEITFNGSSDGSNVLNIPFDVGTLFIIAKPSGAIGNVAPFLNLYNRSVLSFSNVSGAVTNEDFSLALYNADSGGSITSYTSINGYTRTDFHAFSTHAAGSKDVYSIDGVDTAWSGGGTFVTPVGQDYNNFRIGRRDFFAQFWEGDVALIAGSKGRLSNTRKAELDLLLNDILPLYV